MPDTSATDPGYNFTVVDARPAKEKTSETLSSWVTSCDYGITRIGDERTKPSKLDFLKQNLERKLGARLRDATLTVTHYRMHLNARAPLRRQVNGMFTGVVPAMLAEAGEGCTKEKTSGGWYEASENISGLPPVVVEIEAELGGKPYSARSVFAAQSSGVIDNGNGMLFSAMSEADDSLAEAIDRGLSGVRPGPPAGFVSHAGRASSGSAASRTP